MSILDLRKVDPSRLNTERSPKNRLPAYVREKGCFPDFDNLAVGDVVLVAPFTSTFAHKTIQRNQRQSYDELHSMWTHVGIYVGDGDLCEATTKGVKVTSVFNYLDRYLVKFRRVPGLNDAARYRIALRLMRRLGSGYSYGEIAGIAIDGLRGGWRSRPISLFTLRDRRFYTCSGAAYEAIFEATGTSPLSQDLNRVCPADFSISQRLVDVTVGWARLPKLGLRD